MKPSRLFSPLVTLLLSSVAYSAGAADWSLELLVGDAYNANSRTRIEQEDLGRLSFTGDYETRGLEGPLHYAWRVARWEDARAWELQLLHHKIFLQNRPTGLDALSVSHGFNMLTFNRALEYDGWRMRAGLGPVITHVEARVAGSSYDGPYELSGAAALIGLGRRLDFGRHIYLVGEVSATFGYIRAQPDGDSRLRVTIRNPAVHAQAGVGYRF